MAPTSVADRLSPIKVSIKWRPTKIMNMLDLSKDDDFLSHLLVEKLGTGGVPLFVHKMDSSRRLPKTDAENLLQIVRRVSILHFMSFSHLNRHDRAFVLYHRMLSRKQLFSMQPARPSTSCSRSYPHPCITVYH
jgi:hypothetical protein